MTADPVLGLIHRHQELCAEAVDPLEIAAGLEAHGMTDSVAGRFRHRDVFSLAEEVYARVPREAGQTRAHQDHDPAASAVRRPRSAAVRLSAYRAALYLLPGAACAATALSVHALRAQPLRALAVAAVAVPLIALAVQSVVRQGPLRAPGGAAAGGALWTCWLLGFALYGEPAVAALLGHPADAGVPFAPFAPFAPAAAAAPTALALALAPAAWCAHRYAVRSRAHRDASRSLADFAAAVRPLLAGTMVLFLLLLLALLCAVSAATGAARTPAALAGPAALGMLLFTARLLAIHGFPGAAAAGLAAASAVEVCALAGAFLHRVHGLEPLAGPIEAVGPAALSAPACGVAALVLAGYARRALSRASAHPVAP
ncbi:hypothetical protein [Actinacidiphila oryziradicis]|uniref:hypothetical protein n=1 Tax=Actinacidiphila oryziradicis TaxID=2571141 RepID=UPI001B8070E0|nr:hypothetical protein [Actinacidiphila oryziradicis]